MSFSGIRKGAYKVRALHKGGYTTHLSTVAEVRWNESFIEVHMEDGSISIIPLEGLLCLEVVHEPVG